MALIKTETYKQGAITSTIFNIIAKGIGFINSLLIIYIFGSGFETDLYFLILATVALLTSFINGIDLLILIPEAMRLRANRGYEPEKAFLNFFIGLYFIIGVVISALIIILPVIFYSFFSKYGTADLAGQSELLVLSSVLFPIQLLNSLFVSILSSHRYFTIPIVVNLINSLLSIGVLLFMGNSLSIKGAVFAIIAGYTVNFIWLVFFMKKKLGWSFFVKPAFPQKKTLHHILLMELNIFPVSFRSYLTTLLLSGLGVGIITSYNYGQQLSFILEMLVVTQVMAVVSVKFSELSSRDKTSELNGFVNNLLKFFCAFLLPVSGMIALTSKEIAYEIFKYSSKITPEAISNIGLIIFFMVLTLPGRALDLVFTRLITAQQKIREGVIYAIFIHIIIALLVFIGIRLYGLTGFLVAFFVAHNFFLPVLYYFLLKRIVPFIRYSRWIRETLPYAFFNIVLIVLLYFTRKYFLIQLHPALIIAVIIFFYGAAIIIFNRICVYYPPLNNFIDKYILRK